MRTRFLVYALTSLTVTLVGCTAGFRAGGQRAGVEGGAAVGPASPSVTTVVPADPFPLPSQEQPQGRLAPLPQ